MTWSAITTLYCNYLRAARRSPGTIRLHRHYLNHLTAYARSPRSVTQATLERALSRSNWSAETHKSARSVYAAFFGWAYVHGHLEHNPARLLPSVRVPAGQPRPLPDDIYRRVLASADPRLRLMLKLGRNAGLRCSEIARVHRNDLVEDRLYVTGKGGRVRRIPMHDRELLSAIRQADGWLFPNGRGTHLSGAHVTKLLSNALPGTWTGHKLRHAFATALYAATRDLLFVGRMLGHSKPETTQRYILQPDDDDLEHVRTAAA